MSDTNTIDTRPTQADRIRELGGGGLPAAALDIFHEHERKMRQLQSDTRISDSFRSEEIAKLQTETDTALYAARDREVAEAVKAIDQREGAILAEIKGTNTRNRGASIESTDEQRERHFRASRDATVLLADLIHAIASGSGCPARRCRRGRGEWPRRSRATARTCGPGPTRHLETAQTARRWRGIPGGVHDVADLPEESPGADQAAPCDSRRTPGGRTATRSELHART